MVPNVLIPEEKVPILADVDICVVGGSCTGLFAAVRAARLGAKVAIIEKQNRFGGVGTSSMVNMWHSLYDTDFKQQIIGGLTFEIMERLAKREAIAPFKNATNFGVPFNSEELTIELDELALEENIEVHFHTFFSKALVEDGAVKAIIVQNNSGRGAIKAKWFVDASGDAVLCRDSGLPTRLPDHIQPPTTCAKFTNWTFPEGVEHTELIAEHADEFRLPDGFIWGTFAPPAQELYMLNGTRVTGKNPANANDLTFCEIEGRRQVRAVTDIFRKYLENPPRLAALPSMIGVRETYHIQSEHTLTSDELLQGVRFDDAIANGTYPVDIHHQDKPGITFYRLDGSRSYHRPGQTVVVDRWREDNGEKIKFYQIPLRSLIPKGTKNVITAGRMLDADQGAFGATRVMVNLNQTGEAAGITAWLALDSNRDIGDVDAGDVRKKLGEGGSIII